MALHKQIVAKLFSAFDFATRIEQLLNFLYPEFPASSHLLCLNSLVCVGPSRNPYCWFSHEEAHFFFVNAIADDDDGENYGYDDYKHYIDDDDVKR